nr:GDSL esterase/lipase EXL3-like [Ipomoea batatas]
MSCPPPRICLQRRTVCFAVGVLLLFASTGEAKMKLPDGAVIPAIIGLGDSIIDQGMNNYIATVVKCDFPPYGQDFAGGGMPTGRFSNGKTPPDLIDGVCAAVDHRKAVAGGFPFLLKVNTQTTRSIKKSPDETTEHGIESRHVQNRQPLVSFQRWKTLVRPINDAFEDCVLRHES